jgi:chitinase
MDPQTPMQLFQTAADAKSYNNALKIYTSVGGWTFSDNGTATQPVFPDVAASGFESPEICEQCSQNPKLI